MPCGQQWGSKTAVSRVRGQDAGGGMTQRPGAEETEAVSREQRGQQSWKTLER